MMPKEHGPAERMTPDAAGIRSDTELRQAADALADQIMHLRRFGAESGREVCAELLQTLGNPENSYRIVHIAGTNGKGSTAAFLDAILREAGLRVGLFTSPHLERFDERIRVNGAVISDEAWLRLGTRLLAVPCSKERTMFDCFLAAALLYFQEQRCDIAILETGLGGTLDSTNAIARVPEVTILTAIGLDHTAVLGSALSEIAENKAGILKAGTQAVIARMGDEARRMCIRRCEELQIPVFFADPPEQVLRTVTEDGSLPALGLHGSFQIENAANAVLAARYLLRHAAPDESVRAIREGLRTARWPGRMEETRTASGVPVLLDGGHNPQGISALCKSLAKTWPDRRFILLMGVVSDKDYREMVRQLLPFAQRVCTVPVSSERALGADALAQLFRLGGVPAVPCASAEDGLRQAEAFWREAAVSDLPPVIACGSIYFIGELRKMLVNPEEMK